MSYFEDWNKNINYSDDQTKYSAYVQHYYDLEKNAYNIILAAYPNHQSLTEGKALDLAAALGFQKDDMEIFAGFLDGLNPSLTTRIDPEAMDDDSDLALDIDFEKLFWNMRDAKADWLYELPSWNHVLPKEKRMDIAKKFRESKIVHTEKIGRNDPCPCGSGRKYKQCCMK